jgi:2-keto-3-deoxy-L-rhamnonate aldolase RhmA
LNQLKTRLQRRASVFGAWTSLGHPSITEIFTTAGVDFVGIDLEHSTIGQEQAQRIIAAAQAAGVSCLPRVSSHNPEQVRRLLDSGADGVIVPMVSTAAEIAAIVDWIKYPPVGRRSFGVSRAQGYGNDFDRYVDEWNARSVIVAQIESTTGVEAADSLMAHPELDGIMIGPYDLSGSLGVPGQLTHPSVAEACRHVVETARDRGKACGTQLIAPTSEEIRATMEAGYTFIVLASDVFILQEWSARMRTLTGALDGGSG